MSTTDYETDWTATALFSPSKARQQQAQAKDWSFIDAWLGKLYVSNSLPPFERNEDTLQSLLALASLNENADERRDLSERIRRKAFDDLSDQGTSVDQSIHEAIIQSLPVDGSEGLQAMASTTVALNSPETNATGLAECIIAITSESFHIAQQLQRVEDLRQTLKGEENRLSALMAELHSEAFKAPSDAPLQTVEWQRGAKHLKSKLGEYNERLGATPSSSEPRPSIADVVDESTKLQELQQRLAELESSIAVYQGLPADPRAAEAKLDEARISLREATRKRDQLFERLVEKG